MNLAWHSSRPARLDTRDSGYHLTPLDWAEGYAREATRGRDAQEYAEIAGYMRGLRQLR